MKFIVGIFLFISLQANAKSYYFSSSSGNDANNNSINSPWATLAKLNSIFPTLKKGDSILFKCGDTFIGQIVTAANDIVISSYGKGQKPVITGLIKVTGWKQTNSHIWQAAITKNGMSPAFLLKNGLQQRMGRYPNYDPQDGGYLITSRLPPVKYSSNSYVYNKSLVNGIDWTGADVIIKKNSYTLDKGTVIGLKDSSLNFKNATVLEIADVGFGFFIQNDPRTLDIDGEWYANNSLVKIYLDRPDTGKIQLSVVDTLIRVRNNGITISGLDLQGANSIGIFNQLSVANSYVQDCRISFCSIGIYSDTSRISVKICTINQSNCAGIYIANSKNSRIEYDTIRNTGLIDGQGIFQSLIDLTGGDHNYCGISARGANISHCLVDSTGFCGIQFYGDNSGVDSSTVSNFGITKNDCGGIYTWYSGVKYIPVTGLHIIGNTVFNGLGNNTSTPFLSYLTHGIYMDDETNHIICTNNTVFNCNGGGIFGHNLKYARISNNNIYNNGKFLAESSLSIMPANLQLQDDHYTKDNELDYDTVTNNICVTGGLFQTPASVVQLKKGNDFNTFGMIDSNYYINPVSTHVASINTFSNRPNPELKGCWASYDSAHWINNFGLDKHSTFTLFELPYAQIKNQQNDQAKYFANGNFVNDIKGFAAIPQIGSATAIWDTEKLSHGAAKITLTSPSNHANAQLAIPLNKLNKGTYRFSFDIQGSVGNGTFMTTIRLAKPPITLLSEWQYGNIEKSLTHYDFIIEVPKGDTVIGARINMQVNVPDQTIWLSNIDFHRIDADLNSSLSYSKLYYNNSPNELTYNIKMPLYDVHKKEYTGQLKIKPFSSIILFSKKPV